MIGDVVHVEGAPGPTLVLKHAQLPRGALVTGPELSAIQKWLTRTGRAEIRKIALYGPSTDPAYDLDYRFVQCLPNGGFDFRSDCGHSLLACVVAADRGCRPTRVRVVNTSVVTGSVLCEPTEDGTYTVHLDRTPPVPLTDLLPTGRTTQQVGGHTISIVGLGNPYVFVDAATLGLNTKRDLFSAGTEDFVRLLRLRSATARLLGHSPRGSLPKIAAVGTYDEGRLAARAVTVPGWHPALALTGTVCLAAAMSIPGTIPNQLAQQAGCLHRTPLIDTPGGTVSAAAETTTAAIGYATSLRRVSVQRKRAVVRERAVRLPWRTHVTA